MAGETQKEISKKLDAKVKQLAVSGSLEDMVRTIKQFGDKLKKKTGTQKGVSATQAGGLKTGGRVGLKSGSKGCKLAKRGKGRAYGKNS